MQALSFCLVQSSSAMLVQNGDQDMLLHVKEFSIYDQNQIYCGTE
jgi:hypothetical protein